MAPSSRLLGVAILVFCTTISTAFSLPVHPPVVAQVKMYHNGPKHLEEMTLPVYRFVPENAYIIGVVTPEGLANKATDFIYTNSKAPGGGYYTGGIASEILCTSDYSIGCWSSPNPYLDQ